LGQLRDEAQKRQREQKQQDEAKAKNPLNRVKEHGRNCCAALNYLRADFRSA